MTPRIAPLNAARTAQARHPYRIQCLSPGGIYLPAVLCEGESERGAFMNERENIAGTSVLETQDIGIEGMTCDNCVRRVEKALRGVNGVREVHVDRAAALATVTFDTTKTHMPDLHDALLKSGYRPVAREAA
jgi:copper chaperone CopZ